jgi:FeS assembly SUF system protein
MTESPNPPEGPTFGTRFTGNTELRDAIVKVMKTVYDPEIPVDIYELGLIYKVDVDEEGVARVDMTLTSPMCPVGEMLPAEVERKVADVEGIRQAHVQVVWDPPWSQDFMSEAARIQLGFF